MIRIGPAGWSYRDWVGSVYPSPRPKKFDELAYLARYFDTVEINATFYRPAAYSTALRWAERVAANGAFRFTIKLWQRFTHDRDEPWSATEAAESRAAISPLLEQNRLGAVLAQFPWSFRREPKNRAWLDALTKEFADLPLVVEVRHDSWNTPEFFASLGERGIGFVNIDQPEHRHGIEPTARTTSETGYVRVHGRNTANWFREEAGVNERYDYLYSASELLPWAERIRRISLQANDVYVITNNHFEGQAVANAVMLTSMLRNKPAPAPAPTIDRYGDVMAQYAFEL